MRKFKNSCFKKILCVSLCTVLSAVFIVVMFFCAPQICTVPETEGSFTDIHRDSTEDGVYSENTTVVIGEDITAVRISDLGKLGKITKVNYVADRFVSANRLDDDIQIVDLTKPFDFAEKGTLIFVIMNLDAWSENFSEQAEALNEYKIGDYWHFSLSLPKIFCAVNVYLKTDLVAQHGSIENYDFINFTTSYDKKTDKFVAQTERTVLDLKFYTRRQAIDDAYNAAQMVTVHYQSTGSAYSGIADCPLIGTKDAVKGTCESSENLLIAFAIISALVFAIFVVLSQLKRTGEFISAIVWIFGISALLLSRFLLVQTSVAPLFWAAVALCASFIICAGALLSVGRNFYKFPAKYVFASLAAVGALLSFICPFVPFAAASALKIVCTVLKGICIAALPVFLGFAVFDKNGKIGVMNISCTSIITVGLCASVFMPQIFPAYVNPIFWLCMVTVFATFVSVFILFNETEKANAYLTANLNLEVKRQVRDIEAVITERDKLLQFVSHDMKKPLLSSSTLLDTLIEREKDVEQVKAMRIVKQNTSRVISNLSDIGGYERFNYLAEPSEVTDLSALCATLYGFHKPDCIANGIILKNLVDKRYKVFVKKQGLENVISNIILNAVEHANCSTITLSAKAAKNKIMLSISDDGKGVTSEIDVFRPYTSENKLETGGLGLYICKNIIESMNGTLTYESERGNTVFCISLLKA